MTRRRRRADKQRQVRKKERDQRDQIAMLRSTSTDECSPSVPSEHQDVHGLPLAALTKQLYTVHVNAISGDGTASLHCSFVFLPYSFYPSPLPPVSVSAARDSIQDKTSVYKRWRRTRIPGDREPSQARHVTRLHTTKYRQMPQEGSTTETCHSLSVMNGCGSRCDSDRRVYTVVLVAARM